MRRLVLLAATLAAATIAQAQLRFEMTVPSTEPLHGHLVLVIDRPTEEGAKQGNRPVPEPRFALREDYESAQGFGVDVDGLAAGKPIVIDAKSVGYPLENLSALPAGDYVVQAVFNVYEQFHLADGRTLWLPPDRGEGQHWNRKPGNPYSAPVKMHIDPKSSTPLKLTLDKVIPPIEGTDDDPVQMAAKSPAGKWLKYIRFKSEKLSKFWGRDMYLGAWVLLPDGFDEHPDARYPLVVYQDHFHANFGAPLPFNTTPPAANLQGNAKVRAEYGYKFYQDWTAGVLPRVILIYVQNANPYYDDSYVVDSANIGPYGSAINDELIPHIEKTYRGIGQGWARATYGGSTGGWEAAATQVFYPDSYNGSYAACPDPVDFHGYQNVNLYDDENAFVRKGPFAQIPIASERKPDGTITADTAGPFRYQYVIGTHGRSGEQWDIWQAVYSPAGPDGYPAQVIDPLTGAIDKKVVAYWHDHYDLDAILARDWPTLGPKLEGKLHFAVGDADTYFLNNAVHMLQQSLEDTRNPHSDATFQYGPGEPHCYTGGPSEYTMRQNSNNWAQRVLPQMADHMIKTAPAGADVKSWRY
jgi:hypothetical protein